MHPTVPTRIQRSLLVVLLAALIAALPAATALAANPGTTVTFHNQVDTFVDVLPCTDIPYQITTVSNGVEHFQLRTLPDGTVVAQFTFTQTGTFTAVPVSGVGPTFTGTFTVWDGGMAFNPVLGPDEEIISADKWVDTFTFTVRGTGSDGSRIFQHQTGHINQNPLGATNEFFKDSCAA
jgi:hypothetical protein